MNRVLVLSLVLGACSRASEPAPAFGPAPSSSVAVTTPDAGFTLPTASIALPTRASVRGLRVRLRFDPDAVRATGRVAHDEKTVVVPTAEDLEKFEHDVIRFQPYRTATCTEEQAKSPAGCPGSQSTIVLVVESPSTADLDRLRAFLTTKRTIIIACTNGELVFTYERGPKVRVVSPYATMQRFVDAIVARKTEPQPVAFDIASHE